MNGSLHSSTNVVEINLKRGPAGERASSASSEAKWLRSSGDQDSWSFLDLSMAECSFTDSRRDHAVMLGRTGFKCGSCARLSESV